MEDKSLMEDLKDLGRQLLYSEAENTNTDTETIVEIDSNGNKRYVTRAGAGPETHNTLDGNRDLK
ncbi:MULTISPECIES: hypothetical protein [Clostridia]|uniref:hypothetical protein n=1 Tax=Clostridium sp. CCUG 7971 TaxID=2811414 RepID=UPI001ABBC613|nr:hypothetical protein [Clostridium sp. CCUG 7971]MBO3444931.1 hypothetical protein [Clostridium sp. CCUG 7971]